MPQSSVMIVEDEGLIAEGIATQLRASGYDVFSMAASGEDALASLGPSRPNLVLPDLVLMDIRLSGTLDGIETAVRMRSEFDLPVIFLTSHADAETLSRAKRAEPFGYLVKPVRKLNLCSAIEMAMRRGGGAEYRETAGVSGRPGEDAGGPAALER